MPVQKAGHLSTDRALAHRQSLPSSAVPRTLMTIAERDSIEDDTGKTVYGKPIEWLIRIASTETFKTNRRKV
jgi:hypothetical protein